MPASLDYAASGEAGYTGSYVPELAGDYNDAAQMQPFVADPGTPWWQNVIAHGLTRAIDNRYGPVAVQGNVRPGSFAGQNGATYQQGQTPVAASAGGIQTTWLLLGGAALIAFLALR